MKADFILNPIIIAVSLNRGDAKERVVVGKKSQVYSRLNGNAESRVLYDKVRNIGEFIFEHEKQLNKDWNAGVVFPLREALACPVGRVKNENAAWQYLEEKEKCGDSITIFTAACCRRWYEENKTLWGSRRYAKRFEGRIMGLTRSFKQLIVDEEKECTIEKIMDGMRQSTSVYTTDSEMSTTFQYPARKCEGKYLIIAHLEVGSLTSRHGQLERSKRQTMLLKRLPEESAQQTMYQALRKFSVPNNAAHPRKMNRTSKQAAFALGAVEGVLSFVDDAVNLIYSADIVGKLLADFTAVCQIIAAFRISQHGLLGADFPLGGVGDHTVCCVTSAGEEANVGIDAFHKPLRFRSHIGHGMHQKQATGAVILDFLFPKSDGGFWAIGDHNDILQLF